MSFTVHKRSFFANFFIKKSLQIRLIIKIIAAALLATFICSGTLLLVYFLKYDSVLLYQMDQLTNLTKENIIFIILPSLLISSLVNIIIAICLGFYASRKYAVPVYKLEQWATMILQGKINAKIQFRESEELKELSDDCNSLTHGFREKFLSIKRQVSALKKAGVETPEIAAIEKVLESMELEAQTIEIHTAHLKIEQKPDK